MPAVYVILQSRCPRHPAETEYWSTVTVYPTGRLARTTYCRSCCIDCQRAKFPPTPPTRREEGGTPVPPNILSEG